MSFKSQTYRQTSLILLVFHNYFKRRLLRYVEIHLKLSGEDGVSRLISEN